MTDGFFSFLFPRKAKDDSGKIQSQATTPPPVMDIPESASVQSLRRQIRSPPQSSYRGVQTPSPPETAPLSASPPVPSEIIQARLLSPIRPTAGRISTPSPRSKSKVIFDSKSQKSPINQYRRSESPVKLPPSPSWTALGHSLPIPPPTVEFEAKTEKELRGLLKSVPAKTLHGYLTSQLSKLPPSELISLSSILSELEPPPILHCIRCHKPFTDVENTEHSCTVAHDDDSAVVQHASSGRSKLGLKGYETFWGCCGQTVDGEGELGPPSGWCYEGMHTVDPKRARWRDDSTIHDDKLVSCEIKGCFEEKVPRSPRRTRGRKRSRKQIEEDGDEDGSRSVVRRASPSPSAMSVRSTRSAKRRASPARSYRSVRSVPRAPSPTVSVEMSPPPASVHEPSKKKKSSGMRPRSKSVSSTTTKQRPKSRIKMLLDTIETGSVSSSDNTRFSDSEIEPSHGRKDTTKKTKRRKIS